jgi:glycosyltransferase involved in cell wall biosynthesis
MKVVCFAKVSSASVFSLLEFYREDLHIFEELGWEVQVEHRLPEGARASGDVLYAWWGATALPVVIAWKLRRGKVVLTGATSFRDPSWQPGYDKPPGSRAKWRIRQVLTVVASRLADRVLSVSGFELADLTGAGISSAQVAYHSVDTEFYVPGSPSLLPMAVTVAQCTPISIYRKGIELSVAATELVRRAIPDYTLHIVGPVSDAGGAWFEEARRRYDFAGIEVHGQVTREEKRRLLQESSLYLQPSIYEAFGVAVVEAMSCGTVPVCSANGALPEVVAGAGVVLAERTPACLAETIVRLLRTNDVADRSRRARERALDFSRANRAGELQRVIEELVGS